MRAIAPELVLTATALLVIFYDLFLRRENSYRSGRFAMLGTIVAIIVAVQQWPLVSIGSPPGLHAFSGTVIVDRYGLFFKLLFYLATVVVIWLSLHSRELGRIRVGEYYALLICATLAASFLVSSSNLLMLVIALETLSMPSYILAGYRKGVRQAAEASLKYILFGAVASGVLIYGLSLAYGLAGSLQFEAIAGLSQSNMPAFMLIMALLLAGFGFKMSVVPFHFWAPDVYEGAVAPITAYLAVVSKAAGFAVFLRLLAPFFQVDTLLPFGATAGSLLAGRFDLVSMFWVLAVLTMVLGNFVALRQTDIKRLLAYSSIAHAGYLLTAFVASNKSGFHAVLFYFFVYFIANMGIFIAIVIAHNHIRSHAIADYRGLFFRSPTLAVSMALLLWSLIGLPPSAGFVGKWKLFYSVIQEGMRSQIPYFYYVLVLVALITSVVSLYYYISIVRVMCFYRPEERSIGLRLRPVEATVLIAFAAPILAIQIEWEPISELAFKAMNDKPAIFFLTPPSDHLNLPAPLTPPPENRE